MIAGELFTIGHSTHPIDVFAGLLRQHRIDVVADVRSMPYSRYNPQFNKGPLAGSLAGEGVKYLFFGKELGARPDDPSCYVGGKVQYGLLAERPWFKHGIERLITGKGRGHRIAIMCAEKEPLECHRTVLVSQALADAKHQVQHILADGSLEQHEDTLERLLALTGTSREDLFEDTAESMKHALSSQASRIAYQNDVHTQEA